MKLLLLLLFITATSVTYSQTIKMKATGITTGTGEDVIAFETSDTITVNTSGGSGGSSSPAIFENVKIKKLLGASTNELFKRSTLGTTSPDFTFEFYDATSTLLYTIVLRNVNITHFSYLSPECSGCSKLYHQLWLAYQKIEITDAATSNVYRYNLSTRASY